MSNGPWERYQQQPAKPAQPVAGQADGPWTRFQQADGPWTRFRSDRPTQTSTAPAPAPIPGPSISERAGAVISGVAEAGENLIDRTRETVTDIATPFVDAARGPLERERPTGVSQILPNFRNLGRELKTNLTVASVRAGIEATARMSAPTDPIRAVLDMPADDYVQARMMEDLGHAAWDSKSKDIQNFSRQRRADTGRELGIREALPFGTPPDEDIVEWLRTQNPEEFDRRREQYAQEQQLLRVHDQVVQEVSQRIAKQAVERGTDPSIVVPHELHRLGLTDPPVADDPFRREGLLGGVQETAVRISRSTGRIAREIPLWATGLIRSIDDLRTGRVRGEGAFVGERPLTHRIDRMYESGLDNIADHIINLAPKDAFRISDDFGSGIERYSDPLWWAGMAGDQIPVFATLFIGGGGAARTAKLLGAGVRSQRIASAAGSMSSIGGLYAAGTYHEGKQLLMAQGVSEEEAALRANVGASIAGTAAAIFAKLPHGHFIAKNKVASSRIVNALTGVMVEGSSESLQELSQLLALYGMDAKDPEWQDFWRVMDATLAASGVGGLTGGMMSPTRSGQPGQPAQTDPFVNFTNDALKQIADSSVPWQVQGQIVTPEQAATEIKRREGVTTDPEHIAQVAEEIDRGYRVLDPVELDQAREQQRQEAEKQTADIPLAGFRVEQPQPRPEPIPPSRQLPPRQPDAIPFEPTPDQPGTPPTTVLPPGTQPIITPDPPAVADPVQPPVQPDPAPDVTPDIDPSTPIRDQFIARGEGHAKFAEGVDQLVKDGTISEASRDLVFAALHDAGDTFLGEVTVMSDGRLKRAGMAIGRTRRGKRELLLKVRRRLDALKNDPNISGNVRAWANNPDAEGAMVVLHEFGHLTSFQNLSRTDKRLVQQVYRSQPRKHWQNFFLRFSGRGHGARYYSKHADEFLVESFAEWLISHRTPDARLRPILERMAESFQAAIRRIRNRPVVQDLIPIYERMLEGRTASDQHFGTVREAGPPVGRGQPHPLGPVTARGEIDVDATPTHDQAAGAAQTALADLARSDGTFTAESVEAYVRTMEPTGAELVTSMLDTPGPYVLVEAPIDAINANVLADSDIDQQKMEDARDFAEARSTPPPIVVGSDMLVADGTHRLLAAREAGATTIGTIMSQRQAESLGLTPINVRDTGDAVGEGPAVPFETTPQHPDSAKTPAELQAKLRQARPNLTAEDITNLPADRFNPAVPLSDKDTVGEKAALALRSAVDFLNENVVYPDGVYGRPKEWVELKNRVRTSKNLANDKLGWLSKATLKRFKDAGWDLNLDRNKFRFEKALRGQLDVSQLPDVVQTEVKRWRKAIDRASRKQIAAAKAVGLDEKAKTLTENLGTYMKDIPIWTRTFRGRLGNLVTSWTPERALRMTKAFSKFKRDAWIVTEGKKQLQKFDTYAQAEAYARSLIEDGKVDPRSLRMLPPRTEAERMREDIHDPLLLAAVSVVESEHNSQMMLLFHQAAAKWGQDAPKDMTPDQVAEWAAENDLVELPELGELHNLSGKFVPSRIAQDLNDFTAMPTGLAKFFQDFNTVWKASKTIYSLPTHGRNHQGSLLTFGMLDGSSILFPWNWRYLPGSIRDHRRNTPERRVAIREGLIGTEFKPGEHATGDTMFQVESNESSWMHKALRLHRTLGRAYRAADSIYKMVGMRKKIAQGMDPATAARETRKFHQDYTSVSRASKFISKNFFLPPFVTFLDTTSRVLYRAGRERPLRLAMLMAFPGMLNMMSRLAIGLSDEEAEMIDGDRSWLRQYFQPVLPFRDSYGKPITWDLTYTLAFGGLIREYISNGVLSLPFVTGGPGQDIIISQITSKDLFTGRDWQDPGLLSKERWTSLVKTAAPYPGFTVFGPRRIKRSLTGESREDLMFATLGVIAGFNARTPYVSEETVRDTAREMWRRGDHDDAALFIEVWNEKFKPPYMENLTISSVAAGERSQRSSTRANARRKAAEALMKGSTRQMQRLIENYNADRHEFDAPLTEEEVEAWTEILKMRGKTR